MVEDIEHIRAKCQAPGFAEPRRPKKAAHGEVNIVKPRAAKCIAAAIAENARPRLRESFSHDRIQQTHPPWYRRTVRGSRSGGVGDIRALIGD